MVVEGMEVSLSGRKKKENKENREAGTGGRQDSGPLRSDSVEMHCGDPV